MSAEILHFVPMSEMPNRIRELRLSFHQRIAGETKMSQQRLGDAIGVSKMTISDLERGLIQLTVEHMRKIGAVLAVDPGDLLLLQDNPSQLTDDERRLIERYRSGDEQQRDQLQRVAEALVPYEHRDVA
jgi:transcriptional regulator with XRE-family HTH domain